MNESACRKASGEWGKRRKRHTKVRTAIKKAVRTELNGGK